MRVAHLTEPGKTHDLNPDPDPLEYISASRLKCFQTCRLQFYFRYIEKLPTETSPALLVGSAVHGVLQAWNLARWRGEDASVEQMKLVFDTEWTQQCDKAEIVWEDEQEDKEKTKAWNILDHYFAHTPIPLNERPEGVEVRVERDLDAYGFPPLLGYIDLVRKGGAIVDFKSSARSPGEPASVLHQNEIQLGIYALLYREATGKQESGSEIHTLVKTKTPKLVVTPIGAIQPEQIHRLMAQIESYVRGVESQDFVPSPGQHCGWCSYFDQCRQWQGNPRK